MNSRISIILLCTILLTGSFGIALPKAFALVTPSLGAADPFGILASTYTNTVAGTSITGDLGYTTGPAVSPLVSGVTHIADATYAQAGLDQGTALAALNSEPCDFNFVGAIDLSSLTQPLVPGVYCSSGAMDIGGGGTVTLSGAGIYVFRPDGALTTSANSIVTLSGGADACDVFWTPTAATTLGADSKFIGTDIDASGITVGSTVTWTGRALAFGGTVSTDIDTITVPTCQTPPNGVVGGTIIPIDMTSLFVVGAMTNAFWMMPTIGGVAVVAIALFKVKRKSS
ncbi:MAG: ice-binding family protein [Nitrososphaerales archaeon]